jgi:hypothetical protein
MAAQDPSVSEPAPRSSPPRRKTKTGTVVFGIVIAILVVAGVVAVVASMGGSDDGPAVGDHWHAALGVDICGEFLPNAPSFEERAGTEERAGLHSHGDGLMHLHPFVEDEAGGNATVGRFFEYGGGLVTEERIVAWDDTDVASGQSCPDGRVAAIRWSVNGEEQSGNPGDYVPEDGDVITIAFLPEGEPIPEPPSKETLPNPVDVQGG